MSNKTIKNGLVELFGEDETKEKIQFKRKDESTQYTIYLTKQNDEQIEILSRKLHTTRSAVVSLLIEKYAATFEKEISKIL